MLRRRTRPGTGGSARALNCCWHRLGAAQVATVDRKHITAVWPVHIPAFELLP